MDRSGRPAEAGYLGQADAQKLNFSAIWISRGLLLVEVMRPKSPGLVIRPLESMLPPDEAKALRLLIGLAKLT